MKEKPSNSLSSRANSKSSSIHSSTQRIPPLKNSFSKKKRDIVQNGNRAPIHRTSIYKGVTRHKFTRRFEAHLWDKDSWTTQHKKKGRQIYLGAYENEDLAAHAYDLAALKYWGPTTALNFPASLYEKEIEKMSNLTKEEYVATLKRKSRGFSRGASEYRGVAKHHAKGKWEARIKVIGEKRYRYLGTFTTEKEAAIAYDLAAIQLRGTSAVTNFDISTYKQDLHEYDTLLETTDEERNDYEKKYNDEQGEQIEEMTMLSRTTEGFNDMDLGKDVAMDFINVHDYEKFPKLNVSNDGYYEASGELVPLSKETSNNTENYMDGNYDGLVPAVVEDAYDLDMFLDENLYENYALNQYGLVDDEFMQMTTMNPCCDLNQDISPVKEYRTGDDISDLVENEAEDMKDGKGCTGDEANNSMK
ncbi:hypothetical protein DCAR_0625592 [Daucus carota subsp. sativus]|uniref:AP2/ERF domain-containing protein n=1 Tax=Daucus carota subsp. sativus TaxID=79200 RepID=A0AAF1B4C4_DAUCS|nr:PREDICTED: ethylene-responsive transcription factor WRI1-like [Daucus carota subsp. sativus]WOH06169.1 hypothetical protein DCAR_0625592 [Daucus carota subsp. sativus]